MPESGVRRVTRLRACMETRMKNLVLGFALVVGTTVAFVPALPGQDGPAAPQEGRGGGRAGRGGGRGAAPAPPAGPMGKLPDGHPDMQGFWNPPAITDIEPAQGRGGRGGGRGAAPGGGGIAGFGGFAGAGNRIIDPADG